MVLYVVWGMARHKDKSFQMILSFNKNFKKINFSLSQMILKVLKFY
jgi:hypothetical protein